MTHLFKCVKCGRYTLHEDACPVCGEHLRDPQPARFSLQDKYGEYRRKAKRSSKEVPVGH